MNNHFKNFNRRTLLSKIVFVLILVVFAFTFIPMFKNPQAFFDRHQKATRGDIRSVSERLDDIEHRLERIERK
jgi:hypothetical protein